jgi:hypothetical protein
LEIQELEKIEEIERGLRGLKTIFADLILKIKKSAAIR